jgi:hypothetical protein
MAIVWVLGGTLEENQRPALEDSVRSMMGAKCSEVSPMDGTMKPLLPPAPNRLLDYYISPHTFGMTAWRTDDIKAELQVDISEDGALTSLRGVRQLVVPSPQLAAYRYDTNQSSPQPLLIFIPWECLLRAKTNSKRNTSSMVLFVML